MGCDFDFLRLPRQIDAHDRVCAAIAGMMAVCARTGTIERHAGLHRTPEIYTCEDETGRIILRDVPCKRGELVREQEDQPQAPPAARALRQKAQPKYRQKLTEPLVRELAQNVDAAFTRRDMKQLLSLLAGDAVFELEYRLPDGVQVMRYNKEEYTARLREGFKLRRLRLSARPQTISCSRRAKNTQRSWRAPGKASGFRVNGCRVRRAVDGASRCGKDGRRSPCCGQSVTSSAPVDAVVGQAS